MKNPTPENVEFHLLYTRSIEQLTEEQLYWLNEMVIERINYLQKVRDLEVLSKFTRGQKIQWEREGTLYYGSIIKVNQRTITAHEEKPPYRRWKLGPEGIVLSPSRDNT